MIPIRVIEFDGMKIKEKDWKVTDEDCIIIRKNQEYQQRKIIDKLKEYKKLGWIKSIRCPLAVQEHKKIQPHLDRLVKAKRTIKKSIESIRLVFQ